MRRTAATAPTKGRSVVRTVGHLVLAQAFVGAASLVINILAARSMGPAGRGSLALLLQLTYVVNLLAVAGSDRSYPATAPVDRGARAATADMLRLVAPAAVLAMAALGPIVLIIDAGTRHHLAVLSGFLLVATVLALNSALRTGAAASGVASPYLTATVAGQVTLVAAAAVLTAGGADSVEVWLIAYGGSLAVAPMVAFGLLRRAAPARPAQRHSLAPARRLGLRLLPAAVAGMITLRVDRIMLPWLGSYEQLGLYIVVATVAELAIWPVQSYVDAQAPRWHQRFLQGDLRVSRPLLAATAYGVVAGIGLIAAGHLLIVPVLGEEYASATGLLIPLAVGAVGYSVSRMAVGLAVATERAGSALIADIPSMVVALGAYLVLIPRHGAMGAAVGSAVAYGAAAVLAVASTLAVTSGRPHRRFRAQSTNNRSRPPSPTRN
ncbi:hypothetical protein [Micromonospora sp. NPDC126480]|uniref:lipopolysaccharide biosynthesis protein n=1 Tax=Micromonospora sp. NPDC126480 TaxID=3155312 RepID=UPI003329FB94